MKNKKIAKVTDKNAIYVNDIRITSRSTKWGIHNIIEKFEFTTLDEFYEKLYSKGCSHLERYITDEAYLRQIRQ